MSSSTTIAVSQTAVPPTRRLGRFLKRTFAASLWLYIIIKLFVFDIDIYIVGHLVPSALPLLNYRAIFILSILSLLFIAFGKSRFITIALFLVFYPLLVLFLEIPRFILRQRSWNLAIAIINEGMLLFQSLKVSLLSFTLYLLSFVILLTTKDRGIFYVAAAVHFVAVISMYVRRFLNVFRSTPLFGAFAKIFRFVREKGGSAFAVEESMRGLSLDLLSGSQRTMRTANLQQAVLFNRLCVFMAKRLQDYQTSSFSILADVLGVCWLLALTIVGFAVLNYGLHNAIPDEFTTGTKSSGFFQFIFYSVRALFGNETTTVSPIGALAQTLAISEAIMTFLFSVIIIALILSAKRESQTSALNVAIADLRQEGDSMQQLIQVQYSVPSIDEAMLELEKAKAGAMGFILKISQNL